MAKIKDEVFDLCYTPEEGEIVELSRDADGTLHFSQQHNAQISPQPLYGHASPVVHEEHIVHGEHGRRGVRGVRVVRGVHGERGGRGGRDGRGGRGGRGWRGGRGSRGARGGRVVRGASSAHENSGRNRGGQQGRCSLHYRRNCHQCTTPPVHVRANTILAEIAKLVEELNGTRPTPNQIRSMLNSANF